MPTFISLLRGINVGGHRKIRMAELTGVFEKLGLTNVRTYVQSGNVVFGSELRSAPKIAALLEQLTPNPPRGVIRTPYENEKPSMWLAERLEIAEITLPYTIGGTDKSTDLFTLYDETLRMLEEHNP